MRALVVLLAATGCTLLVMWFWREQMRGRVEDTPPLVAQLEKLVEAGAFGGQGPESLVATLVFSEPFKEADPWDVAPKKKGGMSAMFGEPRELAFLEALRREPRTAGWRLPSGDVSARAGAQAQMAEALSWAAAKGVRLRVIAHGAALAPVLAAALAAPPAEAPAVERVLGVGVRLADLQAREPELARALEARKPAGQWLNLYSEPAVVPRVLALEQVDPGLPSAGQELAWPGSSWVPTVLGLSQRGAPQAAPALPAAAPGSQQSVRQVRSAKEGLYSQRVVDGKGNLVSGSLLVPKLDKEEIPPDPEAAENKVGDPSAGGGSGLGGLPNRLIPIQDTGWNFRVTQALKPAHTDFKKCDACMIVQDHPFLITLSVDKKKGWPGAARYNCGERKRGSLVSVRHRDHQGELCKQVPGEGSTGFDYFTLHSGDVRIELSYGYDWARRAEKLDLFMKSIEALEPPPAK